MVGTTSERVVQHIEPSYLPLSRKAQGLILGDILYRKIIEDKPRARFNILRFWDCGRIFRVRLRAEHRELTFHNGHEMRAPILTEYLDDYGLEGYQHHSQSQRQRHLPSSCKSQASALHPHKVVHTTRPLVPRISACEYPTNVREFLRCVRLHSQPKRVADPTPQQNDWNQTSLLPCNSGK